MRKPCFDCDPSEQDKLEFGECVELPLCTSHDKKCTHIDGGAHWEDCRFSAKDEEYTAWAARQNQVQCPCCKGSGFVAKARSIADEIRALEWIGYGAFVDRCPVCAKFKMEGHAEDCKLAAVLRRLK
ncbi:MAG: hypothetical protein WC343_09025 [Bacilli bacterium]